MMWLWIGIALGVAITIPLAAWAAKRQADRSKALLRRAQDAERLAELGTLTGGLAHEIKNPLSTIGLNAQLLREDLHDLARDFPVAADRIARTSRRFDTLSREVERLRTTLDDFLRFAGRMKLQLAPLEPDRLVGELADFFAPQAQEASVTLRTQLAAAPARVSADADLLKQALLNLMINALQAMIDARASGATHGGANELLLHSRRARVHGRDEVHILVTDTGPGIPPDRAEHLFTPYFTTKRSGTGLGLPTARRIVQEHGGTLTFHSDPGRGCSFTLALPAA